MVPSPQRRDFARFTSSTGETGAAAVEFALLVPLLLAIVFGVIAYSMYFTVQIAVTEAAAIGARASVAGLDDGERQSLAINAVNNFFNSYNGLLKPEMQKVEAQAPSQGRFAVTVTYDISSFNLGIMSEVVPLPTGNPTATVTVSTGGL